ncbi:hypothetical protein SESBI_09040 [Sesbania bispinosa]|nr:hypothetical protein SESBI_09040 [Sesbania bispinosa]
MTRARAKSTVHDSNRLVISEGLDDDFVQNLILRHWRRSEEPQVGLSATVRFASTIRLFSDLVSSNSKSDNDLMGLLDRSVMGRRKIHSSSTTEFPMPSNSEGLKWVDREALGTTCWYSSDKVGILQFLQVADMKDYLDKIGHWCLGGAMMAKYFKYVEDELVALLEIKN